MFRTPTFGEKRPASVLAAVAGAQTPWIKELWPDPAALFRADDARRQLWFAVGAQLALRPERAEVPAAPADLAAWLEAAPATDYSASLGAGRADRLASGAGAARTLRLEARGELSGDVRSACGSRSGSGHPPARHEMTEPLIAALVALDPALRRPKLVKALLHAYGNEAARQWTWRLNRLRIVAPDAAAIIETAVRDGAAPTDLLDADGPGGIAPLPPPPWPGTARLRPLRTTAEMRRRRGAITIACCTGSKRSAREGVTITNSKASQV